MNGLFSEQLVAPLIKGTTTKFPDDRIGKKPGGSTPMSSMSTPRPGNNQDITAMSPRKARYYQGLSKSEVSPELLFHFETVENEIPYFYQGDTSHYTTETVGMRYVLKNNRQIRVVIKRFWDTHTKTKDGDINKEEYTGFLIKVQRALYEDFDYAKAKEIAEQEWKHDCSNSDTMSFHEYFDAMFEMVDTWTDDISVESYVDFLEKLYSRITQQKMSAFLMALKYGRKWRNLIKRQKTIQEMGQKGDMSEEEIMKARLNITEKYSKLVTATNSLLSIACQERDVNAIKIILEDKKGDVNEIDKTGATLLMKACFKGYYDVCKLLIDLKVDINVQDNNQNTALHIACNRGYKDIVELLLTNGALRLKNKVGDRPAIPKKLRHFVNDNAADAYALKNGGNNSGKRKSKVGGRRRSSIAKKGPEEEETPKKPKKGPKKGELVSAVKYGNFKLVSSLLDDGADPNERDVAGSTALMLAAWNGDLRIGRELIKRGADVNAQNLRLNTALHFAYEKDRTAFIKLLESKGAMKTANALGQIPLTKNEILSQENQNLNINQILAQENLKAKYRMAGLGVLSVAALEGNIEQVMKCLSKGCQVNERDNNGSTPLHHATWYGRVEVVRILLQSGADPNSQNMRGNTALHFAYEKNNKEIISLLESHGAQKLRNSLGQIPGHQANKESIAKKREQQKQQHKYSAEGLAIACKNGDIKEVTMILAAGVSPNVQDSNCSTPLMHAVWRGNYQLCELLLDSGADPNIQNLRKNTALHFAYEKDNEDIINLLETRGAAKMKNSLGVYPGEKMAPVKNDNKIELPINIIDASKSNNLDLIKTLLKQKVDVNMKDSSGSTALMSAAWNENKEIIETLLLANADPNIQNLRLNTALHFAYEKNNIEIIKLLENHGAKRVKNALGLYPGDVLKRQIENNAVVLITKNDSLCSAVKSGNIEKVKYLIDHGIDINEKDRSGSTPIIHAVWKNRLDIVKLLIENGSDLNLANLQGNTPLHFAYEKDNREIIELLESNGSKKVANTLGLKPGDTIHHPTNLIPTQSLSDAVKGNDYDTVKILVENKDSIKNFNINEKDKSGSTPLIHAVWNGNIEIVKILVENGADVNIANLRKNTPLHFAYEKKFQNIIDYLESHGSIKTRNSLGLLPGQDSKTLPPQNLNTLDEKELEALEAFAFNDVQVPEEPISRRTSMMSSRNSITSNNSSINSRLSKLERYNKVGMKEYIDTNCPEVIFLDPPQTLSPLAYSCGCGDIEKVKECILRGDLIDLRSNGGNTPLMFACCNGHIDIVRFLVNCGANTNYKNKSGQTAVDLAEIYENTQIVNYLNGSRNVEDMLSSEEEMKYKRNINSPVRPKTTPSPRVGMRTRRAKEQLCSTTPSRRWQESRLSDRGASFNQYKQEVHFH